MEAPVGLEADSVEVERVAAGWEVARAAARAAAARAAERAAAERAVAKEAAVKATLGEVAKAQDARVVILAGASPVARKGVAVTVGRSAGLAARSVATEATEASSAVEVTAEARVEAVGSPAMAAGVVERGQMRSEVPTRRRRWRRAGPVG